MGLRTRCQEGPPAAWLLLCVAVGPPPSDLPPHHPSGVLALGPESSEPCSPSAHGAVSSFPQGHCPRRRLDPGHQPARVGVAPSGCSPDAPATPTTVMGDLETTKAAASSENRHEPPPLCPAHQMPGCTLRTNFQAQFSCQASEGHLLSLSPHNRDRVTALGFESRLSFRLGWFHNHHRLREEQGGHVLFCVS